MLIRFWLPMTLTWSIMTGALPVVRGSEGAPATAAATEFAVPVELSQQWIGFTVGRNDLPGGQYFNWITQRAHLICGDGSGQRELAPELAQAVSTWTQFAGWSPSGKIAVLGSHWESAENAAWERQHQTFRMTEGWLSDIYLLELDTGGLVNLTAPERVSDYNTGLFYVPGDAGLGFTPLIDGVSRPYLMDRDGRRKRPITEQGGGFAYGYSASPDGQYVAYHENYQLHVARSDGSDLRVVDSGNPFNFAPQWSPCGQWILFLSGEHYDCHPCLIRPDGSGLVKLADRGGYRGVVEPLKFPDFHSASSDLPVWATDGQAIYFTAQRGASIELFRVGLDGTAEQLSHSAPGVRHYHPKPSPDGRWLLFGSDSGGGMQLHLARIDGSDRRPLTAVPEGYCAMHGHWRPRPAESRP